MQPLRAATCATLLLRLGSAWGCRRQPFQSSAVLLQLLLQLLSNTSL
jgi:hypothetical protein